MKRTAWLAMICGTALASAAAAQDVNASQNCGDVRGTVASCADPGRRSTLADSHAPRPTDMDSFVRKGDRARTLSAGGEARDRVELERRINAELAAGNCEAAEHLARDNGFHGAAGRIRRMCKSDR